MPFVMEGVFFVRCSKLFFSTIIFRAFRFIRNLQKPMKKYIVVLFGLLTTSNVVAQNDLKVVSKNKYLNYDLSIKMYNESSYSDSKTQLGVKPNPLNSLFRESEKTDVLRPTIAIIWRNKKSNFHEIELNRFTINVDNTQDVVYQNGQRITLNGGRTVSTNFSVRYEYIVQFGKKKNNRLVPALGFAVNPYYARENAQPHIATLFPTMVFETGFRTYVVPRATYYFSRKFFVDLNVPMTLAGFSIQYQNIKDPSLNPAQQKYGVFNFDMFRNTLQARVGLGFKI